MARGARHSPGTRAHFSFATRGGSRKSPCSCADSFDGDLRRQCELGGRLCVRERTRHVMTSSVCAAWCSMLGTACSRVSATWARSAPTGPDRFVWLTLADRNSLSIWKWSSTLVPQHDRIRYLVLSTTLMYTMRSAGCNSSNHCGCIQRQSGARHCGRSADAPH